MTGRQHDNYTWRSSAWGLWIQHEIRRLVANGELDDIDEDLARWARVGQEEAV